MYSQFKNAQDAQQSGIAEQSEMADETYDVIMDEKLANNQFPTFTDKNKSLVRKYLTEEVFNKLKDKQSSNGWTIARAVNTGVVNEDSLVGCHAGDAESYELFGDFFDPLIEEYHHGFSKEHNHVTDLDPEKLTCGFSDAAKSKIKSTRIRVARNFYGFPLNTCGSEQGRKDIEALIKKVTDTFVGDMKGDYFSLATTSRADRDQLVKDHILFRPGDRFQAASGYHKYWPSGRGVFVSKDKQLVLWVNEGDHLRIISMDKGTDVHATFRRLSNAVATIEREVKKITGNKEAFMRNDHLGNLTCCPSNLGTGLRGGVHISLPKVLKKKAKKELDLEKIAKDQACQVRGTYGEHTEIIDNADISNSGRLGKPEYGLVQDMVNCVNACSKLEEELED